jgi:hypothetical protein
MADILARRRVKELRRGLQIIDKGCRLNLPTRRRIGLLSLRGQKNQGMTEDTRWQLKRKSPDPRNRRRKRTFFTIGSDH